MRELHRKLEIHTFYANNNKLRAGFLKEKLLPGTKSLFCEVLWLSFLLF